MNIFEKIIFDNNIEIIELPENHYILKENETNFDLFYIFSGKCEGLTQINDNILHMFNIDEGNLIGLISTFEKDHKVLTSVKTTTNVKVAKITGEQNNELMQSHDSYKDILFSMVFKDFRRRMKQLVEQEQHTFEVQEKLILHEKMATVGRVSASLAHELNNSISVISKGLEFLCIELPKILKDKLSDTENKIFSDALTSGNRLTFQDIRKRSITLQQKNQFSDLKRRKISMALEIQNNNPSIKISEFRKTFEGNCPGWI